MTKSRAEEGGDEEKADGLEIISIGSLYSGTWDKKYWSSSRGKDRYPYPVGYQACRAYNGSTCKMEIQEGPKGPLFLIFSVDGQSCYGQTPDIAWEKYQKKGCPRMKIWHGKRFSCKMDGIEFFGFRNPLVQRLFRELVANVNGIAEPSLLSSSFCNGASNMDPINLHHDPSTSSDLLSYLARAHATGKRSKRSAIISLKSSRNDVFKKLRAGDSTCGNDNQTSLSASTTKMHISCIPLGALPARVQSNSVTGKENTHSSIKDGFLLKSVEHCNHLGEKAEMACEESKLVSSKNNECTTVFGDSCPVEKTLDRLQATEVNEPKFSTSSEPKAVDAPCSEGSQSVHDVDLCVSDTELEGLNFPASLECKAVDDPCPEESQSAHDVNFCAPDTLDFEQDNTANYATSTSGKITCEVEEELIVTDSAGSVQLVNKEEPGTSNSNVSSEKSDFDSVGQDIAKSMMTVLLPQAIPLLQKTTRKKQKTISPSVNHPSIPKSKEENNDTVDNMNAQSPDVDYSVVQISERTKSVDFDKFNDDQHKDHAMNQLVLPSNDVEADQLSFGKDTYHLNGGERLVNINAEKSLSHHVETSGSRDVACDDKVQLNVIQTKSTEHTKSVDLDKFNDNQHKDHAMNQLVLRSNDVEADQLSFGKDTYHLNGGERLVNINAEKSLSHHVETSGSRDVACDDKVQFNVIQTKSILDCKSAGKKSSSKLNYDVCQNLDDNPLDAEINFGENLETLPDCDEAVATDEANVEALGSLLRSSKDTHTKDGAYENSSFSSSQVPKKVYARRKFQNRRPIGSKHNPLIIKSVGCRKLADGCIQETARTSIDSETFKGKKDVFYANVRVEGKLCGLHTDETLLNSNASEIQVPSLSVNQANFCTSEFQNASNLVVPSMSYPGKPQIHYEERLIGPNNTIDVHCLGSQQGTGFCRSKTSNAKEDNSETMRQKNFDLELNNELEGIVEFLGCYFHPMPVLSLLLSRKGSEIYICALCGLLVKGDRTLFLYKLVIEGPTKGCPCFVGYTSVTWPSSTKILGREIAFERSGLQLTPDGQCLVLLGSTRLPCCREGRLDCLCSACTLDCFENKGVKIVQVKAGYVSVLVKLRTTDSLQCLLVCEPHHLVAAGENMRLHLWTMNSMWSEPAEEFTIQSNDYISPCIKELKRIPKCNSLVIGHDGFGEFTLWDISKRIFLSKFSAPSNQVLQFCPISLVGWEREVHGFGHSNVEAHVNRLMDATKMRFSKHHVDQSILPLKNEDIAIWFLVSTAPDSVAPHDNGSSDFLINPVGSWRLALLVKNTVRWGRPLDPRAAAISTSAGHGIVGTLDGLVYMWEFLTGKVLGALHKFKGGSASCIASDDDSGSGVLAVADDKGQLLVYLCSQSLHGFAK